MLELRNRELIWYRLSKTRRKRPVPADWATGEEISTYAPATHSEPLYPRSRTLALQSGGDLVLSGGEDGTAGVYSLSQKRVLNALKGSGGSITAGVWAGKNPVIATSAGKVKVFEGSQETASFQAHAGEVTSLAVHPSGDILVSVGSDKSYVLYDLASSQVLRQVYTGSGQCIVPPLRLFVLIDLQVSRLFNSILTDTSLRQVDSTGPLRFSMSEVD